MTVDGVRKETHIILLKIVHQVFCFIIFYCSLKENKYDFLSTNWYSNFDMFIVLGPCWYTIFVWLFETSVKDNMELQIDQSKLTARMLFLTPS